MAYGQNPYGYGRPQMQGSGFYNPYQKGIDLSGGMQSILNTMRGMKQEQSAEEQRKIQNQMQERQMAMQEAQSGRQEQLFLKQLKDMERKEEEYFTRKQAEQQYITDNPESEVAISFGLNPLQYEKQRMEKRLAGAQLQDYEDTRTTRQLLVKNELTKSNLEINVIRKSLKDLGISAQERGQAIQLYLGNIMQEQQPFQLMINDYMSKEKPKEKEAAAQRFIDAYEMKLAERGETVGDPSFGRGMMYHLSSFYDALFPDNEAWDNAVATEKAKPNPLASFYNMLKTRQEGGKPTYSFAEIPMSDIVQQAGRSSISGIPSFISPLLKFIEGKPEKKSVVAGEKKGSMTKKSKTLPKGQSMRIKMINNRTGEEVWGVWSVVEGRYVPEKASKR
jgi:hypothetical protein